MEFTRTIENENGIQEKSRNQKSNSLGEWNSLRRLKLEMEFTKIIENEKGIQR